MQNIEIGDFPKDMYAHTPFIPSYERIFVHASSIEEGIYKFRDFLLELIEVPEAQRLMRKYGITVESRAQLKTAEEKGG